VADVDLCAVCRTDATMWNQGHRDLVLPRVPGHEAVVRDGSGNRYVLWPGHACGTCRPCRSGRENLCDAMTITGFHRDGGLATHVLVPDASLIPVPADLSPLLACFAEPVGCVLNALEKISPAPGDRVLVIGGGTVGLAAALACLAAGARPLVIETNAAKIRRITPFLQRTGIPCLRETRETGFDGVITACPDPAAFALGIEKTGRGGRFAFFSGLPGDRTLDTGTLNLLHYREVTLAGAYGLTRRNMTDALALVRAWPEAFDCLVEAVIGLGELVDALPRILAGQALKIVVDPSANGSHESRPCPVGLPRLPVEGVPRA
jgi:nicotinate-nucleotide--dimethylbenzimidazole phosphoribosyltransferase